MSLPSYARFYRKDGTLVGNCFVNIGWTIDVRNMMRVIFSKFPKQVYTDERIDYFEVYQWRFPMEFIRDLLPLTDDDRFDLLKSFLNNTENYVEST